MPRRKTDEQLEAEYQAALIKRLYRILPDPTIEKFDIRQGYPDLLILCESWWGVLEVKPYAGADLQPNQDFYVQQFNTMSFGSFIWPEIEEEVIRGLQRSFETSRSARISQP